MPVVLYTELDAECDEQAMVSTTMVDVMLQNFSKPRVSESGNTIVFGDTRIPI